MRRVWLSLAGLISRYPLWVMAVAVVATAVLAFGVPRVQFKTGQDAFLPASSEVYQENLRYQNQFGGDPMLVLFEGDILRLLSPPNIDTLRQIEEELAEDPRYFSVVSPLTVVQLGLEQIKIRREATLAQMTEEQGRAAAEARQKVAAEGGSLQAQEEAAAAAGAAVVEELLAEQGADAQRFAQIGELSVDNPEVVEFVLFDADGQVRPEVAGVIPDRSHGLMVIRLAGNMSMDEQAEAAGDVAEMIRGQSFPGLTVLPSGPAILIKEINDTMRDSLVKMATLAIALMIIVLSLVFRADWRLLSLPIVLVGCVWAFGLMGFLALPLTMVTISGLPILIGLGVDFAIQFHSRFEEELQGVADAAQALRESLSHIGPAIGIAVLAASAGFLVLHISRVPMIRDFGSMLTVGTVLLFLAGLLLLHSVLYMRDGGRAGGGSVLATARGRFRVENVVRTITTNTIGRVMPVLAIGLFVVLLGLFLDQRMTVQTDPERFIPQDSQVLNDLYYIRDTGGTTSELGIFVEADDVLRPDVLAWMLEFQESQLAEHSELLRADSLVSLLTAGDGSLPSPEEAEQMLEVVPPGILSSLISPDHTKASIIFSIGDVSLNDRRDLVREMKTSVMPPPGVSTGAGGLSVIGAETTAVLSQNRGLMTVAALGAIALGLLVIYRNPAKAVLPVLPIVLALSGSSVILYLLGIELNPLTSVSGPLIIAMGTEFTVLLMSRYFEERENGHAPREAMDIASLRIGRAITASGLTVIGGFAALAFSNFPLLESFGKVTVLNMGLCLIATLVVLPPLLVWLDEETGLVAVKEELQAVE